MNKMQAFYRRLTENGDAGDSYLAQLRRLSDATLDEVQVFQSNLDWYEWGSAAS